MPVLRLETNVKASEVKDLETFMKLASKAVAELLGKPETYVIVAVNTDQNIIMGETIRMH